MDEIKFGRYEIQSELGRGGMATVYHATDPLFGREVAIKVLPREMLHDPQFRTRFEREAKTIAKLEHPAIVPVYDFGEEDGQPYFVMRYMPGGSLADRMKKGPISVEEATRLLERIGPALDEAHAKGIIHRDLKPGNILYDQYGEPYVSDFGIAKLSTGEETSVTGSAIVGTPAYMSPEQGKGEKIDGRSDIYGLGVILFEMLTGKQPYEGDTPMSVVVKHITDPVPHILDVKSDLPSDIEGVIDKTLAKEPDQRFQDVRSLTSAMSAVSHGEHPDLETKGGKTRVISQKAVAAKAGKARKRTGLWIGLAAIVILLGGAAAGLYFFKDTLFPPVVPAPTDTLSAATTETLTVQDSTGTVEVAPPPVDTPTPTTNVPALPVLGGTDQIAFLDNNDIWSMNVDGTGLVQLTRDGGKKSDLQWALDGNSIYYILGKCVQNVTFPDGVVTTFTCFSGANFFDGFNISPDGSQVAISVDRILSVISFDPAVLQNVNSWAQIRNMHPCFVYGNDEIHQVPALGATWSKDGKTLAAKALANLGGSYQERIYIFDLTACPNITIIDRFPGSHFTMVAQDNYSLPHVSWNGDSLFLLNSAWRYSSGYLYSYDYKSFGQKNLDPFGTQCCYNVPTWSPDGTYAVFTYQNKNMNKAPVELYFEKSGFLTAGGTAFPISLPEGILQDIQDYLEIVMRPAR